jgi:hypothetical protein
MSQSTTPAPAPSSAAPVRKFAVVACIKKDGQRVVYRMHPAGSFSGSFVPLKTRTPPTPSTWSRRPAPVPAPRQSMNLAVVAQ